MTDLTRVLADDRLIDRLAAGDPPDPDDPAAVALAGWRDQQHTAGGESS